MRILTGIDSPAFSFGFSFDDIW